MPSSLPEEQAWNQSRDLPALNSGTSMEVHISAFRHWDRFSSVSRGLLGVSAAVPRWLRTAPLLIIH